MTLLILQFVQITTCHVTISVNFKTLHDAVGYPCTAELQRSIYIKGPQIFQNLGVTSKF